MSTVVDDWVRESLALLAVFQFTERGHSLMRRASFELVAQENVAQLRGPRIVIPVDVPAPLQPAAAWSVAFGGSEVRLWNPIARPGAEWSASPSESNPAWWRHPSGTLTPAWNLWANVRNLLTFREDREITTRDEFGRFPPKASPRSAIDALDVPVANDTNAMLLDALVALAAGEEPRFCLDADLVAPPGLVLSHDLDQLRGNDWITQGVRVQRASKQLLRGGFRQAARHLRGVAENAVFSRRYFAGNVAGMIDLERQFGFRSVCYFLTGEGGRFGARSGNAIIKDVAPQLPAGWDIGVHYNFNTVGSNERMFTEIQTVAHAAGTPVTAGRAHYLRFDPVTHPEFLEHCGIRFDESVGWAQRLAYRAGIAGPFRPLSPGMDRVLDVLELPMTCMDSSLLESAATHGFEKLFEHLCAVGGLLSVLIHPGAFYNPEQPAYSGMYEALLARAYSAGSRSWTPSQLLVRTDNFLKTAEN